MSKLEFTWGDLQACGFLLGEFNNDAAAALRWLEQYPAAASQGMVLFLREAEKRATRHMYKGSKAKRDGTT